MPNKEKESLFQLVKSMTPAEKRHFQVARKERGVSGTPLYRQLFQVMDQMGQYQEKTILRKIPGIRKAQLSNLKGHLYSQLLSDLRLLYKQKDPVIALREQLDYAHVLYDKGLYLQSLRILGKIKVQAQKLEEISLCHEIIELEKLLESRHITPGMENRTEALSAESRNITRQLNSISNLSTLSLRMYSLYLKLGHVRNEKDARMVRDFLGNQLKQVDPDHMGFYEKIYLYQIYCWYHYTLQEFLLYYRYSAKWVELFGDPLAHRPVDLSLYLKAMHNLLTACFYTNNAVRFNEELRILEAFLATYQGSFDENTLLYSFIYRYTALLNKHFLEGTFSEGIPLVPQINRKIEVHKDFMDPNRIMVFYYKIGCLYFGAGDFSGAIDYLNRIIQMKVGELRQDIQCYARILHLIAHFEMEHYTLVEYLIKSVYHYIYVHRDLSLVLEEVIRFLRRNLYANPAQVLQGFQDLHERLIQVSKKPLESRSFLYLDIISWLESKLRKIPVQQVIREKFEKGLPRF